MGEAPPTGGGAGLPPEVVQRLLTFLCGVAWIDRAVQPQERAYFQRLLERFQVSEDDARAMIRCLQSPPPPDALHVESIPAEHRRRFLAEAERVANADGRITPGERLVIEKLRKAILGGR
jgi:uncharacterized tellurite resistance protein B-like protein